MAAARVPIACYAVLEGDQLWLRGLVGQPVAERCWWPMPAPSRCCRGLGRTGSRGLTGQGAEAILKEVYGEAGHP
jgi:hydroxymethylbilane synthase